MESKKYKEEIEELKEDLFIIIVSSYEADLIKHFEMYMNIGFKGLKKIFKGQKLMIEINDNPELLEFMQQEMEKRFYTISQSKKIFKDFQYGLDDYSEIMHFQSGFVLDAFWNYLNCETRLKLDKEDLLFDFLYYFYFIEEGELKETAKNIIDDFILNLFYYIIYRDYLRLVKFFNPDLADLPQDSHIAFRIALLDSLNLISDLNNNVPNKENIYRIVHAIVGGNEDNVKKYCLSLIGKNSTSQKQITRRHKEFAQKYINEKKL